MVLLAYYVTVYWGEEGLKRKQMQKTVIMQLGYCNQEMTFLL